MSNRYVAFFVLVLALAFPGGGVLANQSDGSVEPEAPVRYFVKSYAEVLAGRAIDLHCNFFNSWQKRLIKSYAMALEPVMGQRLSTADRNQALQISNKLILENTECGDPALTAADQALFSAHALLFGRPPALSEEKMSPQMKEFLNWARAEISAHEERRARRLAALQREKLAKAERYVQFTAATEAYYLERLCQHLNSNDARTYWKIIAGAHKQAVAKHGVKKVKRIQSKAVDLAKTQSRQCGTETRKLVLEGFQLAKQGFEISSLVLP
ncbi:MAG: hypothetical protein AAF441_20650 [Pseudomonadota bacterium]